MRVLLLNQTFYPDQAATSQQLLDLAEILRDQGCEVTVFSCRRSYFNPNVVYPKKENLRGIQVFRVGSTGFGKRSFFFRFLDGLSFEFLLLVRLLFSQRQDLVVAFTSPPLIGLAARIFTLIRGGKSVQWMMDINPDIAFSVGYMNPKSLAGRFLTFLLRVTVRTSDFVVVLDKWMRRRIGAHGVSSDRIVIVPPWPVSPLIPPDPSLDLGRRFREQHGLAGKFVVLYSGNHSIAHPMDTLLEAALILRDCPTIQFLFIGGGLRVAEVTAFQRAHRLTNIQQIEHQPREGLAESLACANLHVVVMGNPMSGLVHTSKIYGVLATGKPYVFVGPRASHVGDLIEECPYGYLVEQGDCSGLINTIRHVQTLDPSALNEIFEKNIDYVRSRCSAAQSLAGFLSRVVIPEQAAALNAQTQSYAPSRA